MTGQGWDMIGFEQEHVSSYSGQYQELVQKITFPFDRWATATLLLDSRFESAKVRRGPVLWRCFC